MKTSRAKWLFRAAFAILLFVSIGLVCWLCFTIETAGDHDACHVIAMNLVDAAKPPVYGEVPPETVDAVALYLGNASVIGVKRTPDGPRAGFGSRFHAVPDERGITCWTDGWIRGWGAESFTVPWSTRDQYRENPNDPWEPLIRKTE
jgi:hypothetical protein